MVIHARPSEHFRELVVGLINDRRKVIEHKQRGRGGKGV